MDEMLLAILLQQAFVHSATADYQRLTVEGHPVLISPAAKAEPETKQALELLASDLKDVRRWLPREANMRIAKVAIWVEWENPDNPGACFHPSKAWLSEHGYNVEKEKCVEIGNVRHYLSWTKIQPCMVLHELSHAYMNLSVGDDNPDVLAAYKHAMDAKLYDDVAYANGTSKKAYAATNHKEYFAELSEAYFGRNDFYPFVRSDLKKLDPQGYKMIDRAWHKAGE